MKKTDRYLYEKEIKSLKKQNARILVRCEHAEKYSNEYKKLCEENRMLAQKYRDGIQKLKNLEKGLEAELERLKKKQGDR